jgi:hypothetical protein
MKLPHIQTLPVMASATCLPTEIPEMIQSIIPANNSVDTVNKLSVHFFNTFKRIETCRLMKQDAYMT